MPGPVVQMSWDCRLRCLSPYVPIGPGEGCFLPPEASVRPLTAACSVEGACATTQPAADVVFACTPVRLCGRWACSRHPARWRLTTCIAPSVQETAQTAVPGCSATCACPADLRQAAAIQADIAAAASPEEAARIGRRAQRTFPHLARPDWRTPGAGGAVMRAALTVKVRGPGCCICASCA